MSGSGSSREPSPPPRRISIGAVAAQAAFLFAASSLTFVVLETVIHWHAGLGWHGVHCLTGPVHRDAIPLLAALSLCRLRRFCGPARTCWSWMRRVIRRLAARVPAGRTVAAQRSPDLRSEPHRLIDCVRLGARGPPLSFAPLPRAAPAVRSPSERKHDSDAPPIQTAPISGACARDGRCARPRRRRVGARDRQPTGRESEGAAAVHALGSHREGERDNDADRADGPGRLRDRLVRASPDGLEARRFRPPARANLRSCRR